MSTFTSLTTTTANQVSITTPSVQFIVGGRGYMTDHEQQQKNEIFDFGQIYPSACLFCGILNGKPIAATTSDPCITNAPTMQHNRNDNQKILYAAIKVPHHHNNNNVSKSINSYFKAIKRFFIRKQLYLFTSMNKRRFAF